MLRLFAVVLAVLVGLGHATSAQSPRVPGSRPPPTRATLARSLALNNASGQAIAEVHISPSSSTQWGGNLLSGHPIAAGRTERVPIPAAQDCRFDIRVVYADGSAEERLLSDLCRERRASFTGREASRPTVEGRTVTLENRQPAEIAEVYISPASSTDWGRNVLDATLTRDETRTANYVGSCEADIRIVYETKVAEERHAIDVCQTPTIHIAPGWLFDGPAPAAATAPARPEPITIINHSDSDIRELYIFADGDAFGADRLGDEVLRAGQNRTISLARGEGCRFTIRVVYQGGHPNGERSAVDLCTSHELVIRTTPPAIQPGSVTTVVNGGRLPIVALYFTPTDGSRGIDRLGATILGIGQAFELPGTADGQCHARIIGMFRDGREATAEIDQCGGREVTLR